MSIGVVINSFLGCKAETDCLVKGKFIFVNNTASVIRTSIGVINPKDTLVDSFEDLGACEVTHLSFVPPLRGSTVVYFGDKCLSYIEYKIGSGEGVVGIENYQWRKIAERHYEFTYTFTEEEAKKATPCP